MDRGSDQPLSSLRTKTRNPFKGPCFSCASCQRGPGDHASPGKTNRTVFLAILNNHLDLLQEHLTDTDWHAFSGELYDRIFPSVDLAKQKKLKKNELESMADGIREQCRAWAESNADVKSIVTKADEDPDSMTVALPKRWREDQELLNEFHRLFRKLGDEEAVIATDVENGSGFMKIGLFFYTDREPSGVRTPAAFLSTKRAREMSTGVIKVSLPDFDGVASNGSDLPYLWSHSPRRATGRTSNSPEVSACALMEIRHLARQSIGYRGAPREAIVFLHGFNTPFAWSAQQMATYAYKMKRGAPIFMYEWPSFESVHEYGGDEANATWTVPHFVTFLKDLLTSYGLEKVHIFSHSLGGKVALYALLRMTGWKAPRKSASLGQLLLVAPDFDTGEFYEMQREISGLVERITLYCSSNDKALTLSAKFHGGIPRLGHFNVTAHLAESRHVALSDNIDVIDATGLDKSMAGHTYAFSRPDVMEDVCDVIRGKPARARPALRSQEKDGFRYFRFVGSEDQASATEKDTVEANSRDGG